MSPVGQFFFSMNERNPNLAAETQACGHEQIFATETQFNNQNPNWAAEILVFQYQAKEVTGN